MKPPTLKTKPTLASHSNLQTPFRMSTVHLTLRLPTPKVHRSIYYWHVVCTSVPVLSRLCQPTFYFNNILLTIINDRSWLKGFKLKQINSMIPIWSTAQQLLFTDLRYLHY